MSYSIDNNTIVQSWNVQCVSIEEAIEIKLAELYAHDSSAAVNDYFVMGVSMASIGMWKDKYERAAIMNGAQSKLRKGIAVMDLPIGNTVMYQHSLAILSQTPTI